MANTSEIPVVLLGQIDAGTVTTSQTYNNPNSTLNFIAPYYMNVTVNMAAPQFHYDDTTTTQFQYDFNNLEVGMWIAEQSGKAWLITDVTIVNDSQANLTIKDVNLFNVLSDPTFSGGYGSLPSGTGAAIIFNISEDGVPVIPSVYLDYSGSLGDISYWVATDVITRFQYRNVLKSHYNNSNSPNAAYINYEVGQMVYLDNTGTFQVLDASDATQVKKRFGVITSVNEPEDGDLGVRPWGKVIGDLDLSSFIVGDALYYDDTDPTGDGSYLTATEPTSSAIPMYIKISHTSGMYITDMVGGGGDQIYNSTFDGTGATTIYDVGGVPAGTSVEDLDNDTNTISEILDMIFFPATCPSTSGPSNGFSTTGATFGTINNVNAYYIVGEQVSATFTLTANGGSIAGQAGTYAGALTSATLSGPDIIGSLDLNPDASYNVDDYVLTNWPVELGANTWTYSGTFAAGQDVLDSYDNATCGNYPGSSFGPSKTLYGTYPILLGTNVTYTQGGATATFPDNWNNVAANTNWTYDASSTSSFPLMTASQGLFPQNYTENAVAGTYKRHRIAIPNVTGVNVTNIQFYDAFQAGGAWIDCLSDWTTSSADMIIYGDTITYTIYERTISSAGGGIPEYKVIF